MSDEKQYLVVGVAGHRYILGEVTADSLKSIEKGRKIINTRHKVP